MESPTIPPPITAKSYLPSGMGSVYVEVVAVCCDAWTLKDDYAKKRPHSRRRVRLDGSVQRTLWRRNNCLHLVGKAALCSTTINGGNHVEVGLPCEHRSIHEVRARLESRIDFAVRSSRGRAAVNVVTHDRRGCAGIPIQADAMGGCRASGSRQRF